MSLNNLYAADIGGESVDIFIAAHGYESRATAVARKMVGAAKSLLCFGFDHNQVLFFSKNLEWFREHGFRIFPNVTAAEFAPTVTKALFDAAVNAENSDLRIAVDISSFDRYRLACLIDVLEKLSAERRLTIDFWYSIAAFERPRPTVGRNEIAGPVHRKFAGRFLEPGKSLALIAGLGYELGKVVGVTEYLQASRVVAMFPVSPIAEYEAEVSRANETLLRDLQEREIIRYRVDDVRRTVATLDAAVRGLSTEHNVVLFPGGPKVFVLCCLLAQRANPSVAVWRVSSGPSIRPHDSAPSGVTVGARWEPRSLV